MRTTATITKIKAAVPTPIPAYVAIPFPFLVILFPVILSAAATSKRFHKQ